MDTTGWVLPSACRRQLLHRGVPTYTLGITPQPHNEGDFTTLGRVVRGMEVVDRIQMGDRIISARRIR